MNKTIAVGSASLLGLTASAFGAGAAQAAAVDPVIADCTSDSEHVVESGGVASNWYMACLPQYALATVDFDITSTDPFPAGFVPLDDPSTTTTTTSAPAGDAYFGITGSAHGVYNVQTGPNSPTANSQSYEALVVVPIASRASIPVADAVTAGCPVGLYTNAYKVSYLPTTVSFTQTVAGEEWRYDVVVDPTPLYLALSLSTANDGTFDEGAPMCAIGANGSVLAGTDDSQSDWEDVASVSTIQRFNGSTLSPYFGNGKQLPDVARTVPTPPAPPADPALAPTGIDPTAPLGVAALFLALGVTGGYLSRRRAKSRA